MKARLAVALMLALSALGCDDDKSPYFGATTRTGKQPTTFYVNAGPEPELLDPGRANETVGTLFIGHLFEGLSVYHPKDAHATQGVAYAWDKGPDNRLFRFHLRPEAVWPDKKRVTASDFVYSWSRTLRPSLASRAATLLYALLNGELYQLGKLKVTSEPTVVREAPNDNAKNVAELVAGKAVRILKTEGEYAQIALHERLPTFNQDKSPPPPVEKPTPLGFVLAKSLVESPSVLGVRAVDDGTIEIETERPVPYFLDLTCYSAFSPLRRDVIEPLEKSGKLDQVNRPENIVGNGPYSITSWKFRYEIVTTKSPTYWRASQIKTERVVWMSLEDSRTTLNLYKAGDLDYTGDNSSIPMEVLPFVAKKKDFVRSAYLSVYWYELNVNKPPLDDVRVRRALNLAIDKTELVEKVTRGGQIPASHYVPDFTGSGYAQVAHADKKAGKDPFSGPEMEFSPERARSLLAEAGYKIEKDGEDLRVKDFPAVELLYNTNEGNRAIAVAIQNYWRKNLGISVNLRNEEWKVMVKTLESKDFQIARLGWAAEYNHPETWLDTFLSYSPQNRPGWKDPEYDRMVKEAAQVADLTESIRKFRRAEERAVLAMPRIPLYFYTKSALVKPWVRGYSPNPRNIHLMQWLWIDETGRAPDEPAAKPLEYAPPGPFSKGAPDKAPEEQAPEPEPREGSP